MSDVPNTAVTLSEPNLLQHAYPKTYIDSGTRL